MKPTNKLSFQSGREALSNYIPGYTPLTVEDCSYDTEEDRDCADKTVKLLLGSFAEKVNATPAAMTTTKSSKGHR